VIFPFVEIESGFRNQLEMHLQRQKETHVEITKIF